jgi:hypothetical protein
MPVTITVSEVRRALYLAAGAQSAGGDGSPSVGVLGQWFHDAIGWLVEERQGVNTLAILADVDEDLEADVGDSGLLAVRRAETDCSSRGVS